MVHLAADTPCASAGRKRKGTTDPREPRGCRCHRRRCAGRGRSGPGAREPRRGRHGSVRGPAAHEQALYYQVLNFAMIVSSALMIWKGLIVVTGSESPIVVVLSGSMEPAFHRGDLLFLTNFHDDPIRAGEIVVFKVEGRDIPIVHRVIKVHEKGNGNIKFLTKGDNNEVDDRGLYKEGQNWLEKKDVVGRARGFLPYVGMVTIIMNDYPKFKYALLAVMGAYVLLKRES
ncbi:signal peptidase complex catalytic subunit SEC11C isoform X1 [Zonotrichia leucophrys gambelii]|uniref:signal peptidase complex catalytic subunit SEC11C isoform X1 n=1 Tax=Zonotrichia leucophrys gambelii TaxID=257770 RepID=UPI00313FF39A